jgi:uncharacterized membrane protein
MPDSILADIPKLVSIYGLAFFSFWTAIPAGLALGLAPVTVVCTTSLSYASGVALVTLFGERVRAWLAKRHRFSPDGAGQGRIRRIAERYGALGLGLVAPMTLGAQIGAALGMALNLRPRRLFIAMALGGLAWSIALTAAFVAGVTGIQAAR